jgi:hypothetical protein
MRKMLPDWRIKRAKLIDSAVGIIKPVDVARNVCREDVARVTLGLMGEKALLSGTNQIHTKDGKLAAASLASALRRVEAALKDPDLDAGLRGIFAWRFPADKVQNFTEDCEHYSTRPSPKLPRKGAEGKRAAVSAAHSLLLKYASGEAGNPAKGSKFCKLAVVLYGAADADLQSQCRAFLRGLKAAPLLP